MPHARRLFFVLAGLLWSCAPTLRATSPAVSAPFANATIRRLSGEEALSRPYAFEIDLTLPGPAGDLEALVGQQVTLQVSKSRTVTGLVESLERLHAPRQPETIRLRLVPSLGRLAYRTGTRTFYNLTAIQVVKAVLDEAGLGAYEFQITGNLPVREMVLQYQESDLAFLSRLLEAEGIHYHFEAAEAGERLIFADTNGALPPHSPSVLRVSDPPTEGLAAFHRGLALRPGQVKVGDYNWRSPTQNLSGSATTGAWTDLADRVFPAGVRTVAEAKDRARLRLEAQAVDAQRTGGQSSLAELRPGYRFMLQGSERASFDQEYVITAVHHRDSGDGYHNTFECVPMQVPFRPAATTPVPRVAGVVPAIVVGPAGTTKHVDQYGRVQVRFPWRGTDNASAADQGDAGWVRVLQLASGRTGTTALFLPDVGDEVAVAFEQGDLDHPVVLGGLFNGQDTPPMQLPDQKDVSLIRVKSAAGTISEVVLDNTSGKEGLTLRSGAEFISISPGTGIRTSSPVISPQPPKPPERPKVPASLVGTIKGS
jgi:type VI secretion system secreted protein VgrG